MYLGEEATFGIMAPGRPGHGEIRRVGGPVPGRVRGGLVPCAAASHEAHTRQAWSEARGRGGLPGMGLLHQGGTGWPHHTGQQGWLHHHHILTEPGPTKMVAL